MGGYFGALFAVAILVIEAVDWHAKAYGSAEEGTKLKTPLRILEERYAKGEISTTEFKQRMKELEGRE